MQYDNLDVLITEKATGEIINIKLHDPRNGASIITNVRRSSAAQNFARSINILDGITDYDVIDGLPVGARRENSTKPVKDLSRIRLAEVGKLVNNNGFPTRLGFSECIDNALRNVGGSHVYELNVELRRRWGVTTLRSRRWSWSWRRWSWSRTNAGTLLENTTRDSTALPYV
jgi:hypothetical protein